MKQFGLYGKAQSVLKDLSNNGEFKDSLQEGLKTAGEKQAELWKSQIDRGYSAAVEKRTVAQQKLQDEFDGRSPWKKLTDEFNGMLDTRNKPAVKQLPFPKREKHFDNTKLYNGLTVESAKDYSGHGQVLQVSWHDDKTTWSSDRRGPLGRNEPIDIKTVHLKFSVKDDGIHVGAINSSARTTDIRYPAAFKMDETVIPFDNERDLGEQVKEIVQSVTEYAATQYAEFHKEADASRGKKSTCVTKSHWTPKNDYVPGPIPESQRSNSTSDKGMRFI